MTLNLLRDALKSQLQDAFPELSITHNRVDTKILDISVRGKGPDVNICFCEDFVRFLTYSHHADFYYSDPLLPTILFSEVYAVFKEECQWWVKHDSRILNKLD